MEFDWDEHNLFHIAMHGITRYDVSLHSQRTAFSAKSTAQTGREPNDVRLAPVGGALSRGSKLKIPDFETEGEEAAWWFENQDAIAREYAEDHAAELLALVIDENDVKVAAAQATAKSVSTRDYVRRLFQDALQDERAA